MLYVVIVQHKRNLIKDSDEHVRKKDRKNNLNIIIASFYKHEKKNIRSNKYQITHKLI